MANPGKNKLLRWTRIMLGAYDISGDERNIGGLDNTFENADLTGLSNVVKWGMSHGVRSVGVSGVRALLNDAAAGAFTQMKDAGGAFALSVLFGGGAEPAVGDPAYVLDGVQISSDAGWDGGVADHGANFLPKPTSVVKNPWGVILSNAVALTTTTAKDEVDNGAASTNGWHANLHILTAGGAWTFTIEHSTTGLWGGEEATLGTFTLDGDPIGAETLSGTGTVNQYTRFLATNTSGSGVVPVCTFARD